MEAARRTARVVPFRYSATISHTEINMEDLLRRPPVWQNPENFADYIKGRIILVTGAGGSIGSEIVHQIATLNPQHLVLLGRGEYSLYEIEQEMRCVAPKLHCTAVIANCQNHDKLQQVFDLYRPHVIFHTAAHKHVPMMEFNPDAAILNNVGGTKNMVALALQNGVDRFVNISTDKAVNPTSIMGATKRVAEYMVQVAAEKAQPKQIFASVRFGNVLGSRGSVIPLFLKQIHRGGPLTITHPEMRRYFMTIPEAAQLVLQAGALQENGSLVILDMGKPIKIVDLACDMIRLSGLRPYQDIKIVFSGTRPGERLFEDYLSSEEAKRSSHNGKLWITKGFPPQEKFETLVNDLFLAAKEHDEKQIRNFLEKLVPTYTVRRKN